MNKECDELERPRQRQREEKMMLIYRSVQVLAGLWKLVGLEEKNQQVKRRRVNKSASLVSGQR